MSRADLDTALPALATIQGQDPVSSGGDSWTQFARAGHGEHALGGHPQRL